jgi:uncharacterized protein
MASAVRKHYSDSAQTNDNGVRLYLDTSALVKLIVAESESTALTDYLQRFAADDLFTAALARTELVRAVVDGGPPAITPARAVLDSIDTVALSRAVLDDAATLPPPLLRTLDAIHLAAAQRAGTSLRAVVTYDGRMVEAAAALGMPHVSPM